MAIKFGHLLIKGAVYFGIDISLPGIAVWLHANLLHELRHTWINVLDWLILRIWNRNRILLLFFITTDGNLWFDSHLAVLSFLLKEWPELVQSSLELGVKCGRLVHDEFR